MRALLLSDIHGNMSAVKEIATVEEGIDIVLVSGDLTDFGPPESASEIVEALEERGPVYAVPGNCDPPRVEGALDEAGVLIDRRAAWHGEFQIAGLGGSGPTPFGTPREYTEDELSHGLERARGTDGMSILVSHSPPLGTVDLDSRGRRLGSRAVLDFVEAEQPSLVATGHVHEARGDGAVGDSLVGQPGTCFERHGCPGHAGERRGRVPRGVAALGRTDARRPAPPWRT